MNEIGVLVVVGICEAIADYVDADPKGAAHTARRLAQQLKQHVDQKSTAAAKCDELRAQRGQF